MNILEVNNLSVNFDNISPVNNISFALKKNSILGIVGESGSGKSLTALSILGLLPYPKAYHTPQSSIKFNGIELIYNPKIEQFRGGHIGYIFQEPMSSLNPLHTIGNQIAETLIIHQKMTKKQAYKEVLRLLKLTGIKNPKQRFGAYPHELSGGQRQRVMIAMAIANKPDILIADEPTTALDVTIQEQIIDLLLKLKNQMNMSIIFISHDLKLINRIADDIIVMKSGKIVEQGDCKKIFTSPSQSYTKELICCNNKMKLNKNKSNSVVAEMFDIIVKYPQQKNFWGKATSWLYAVNKISLSLKTGETIGIVGESGSGKTTLGQALCQLIPYSGNIYLQGVSAQKISPQQWHKDIQIVFQDPYGSLNPRMNVAEIIGEGLDVHFPHLSKIDKKQRITKTLKDVGLSSDALNRYPHEFSGGQRQRIAIARALVVEPKILVLDEPTSALDVTIQRQIINLLQELQSQKNLCYLFISHNMQVIQEVSDEVYVMKDGKIVEFGSCDKIYSNPQHPYTKQLIKASLL